MAIRTGSITRELASENPDLLEMILEDYKRAARREKSSRQDFAMGWLARARRAREQEMARRQEVLPW